MHMIRSLLLLLALTSLPQSSFGDERAPSRPPCEEGKVVSKKNSSETEKRSLPTVCPLWEVLRMGGGNLYYCDYFQTGNCTDPPDVVYAFGVYSWPCSCTGSDLGCCFHAFRSDPFPGLLARVPEDYELAMPSGRSGDFSRVLADPELRFAKCTIEKETFFAKVFVIALDVKGADGGIPHSLSRCIYVAFETTATPISFKELTCDPLQPSAGGEFYGLKTKYSPSPTQKIPVLILRARRIEK